MNAPSMFPGSIASTGMELPLVSPTCYAAPVSELSKFKERESARRMELIRKAKKSPRAAKAIQKQVSLAGQKNWKITNLAEVGTAMAQKPA